MRTELVWEGKYDEYGNRREIDVAGLDYADTHRTLPFVAELKREVYQT